MIDKDLKIYDTVCTGCSACTEACAFPDDNGINPIQLIQNTKGLYVPRIDGDICTTCMACYKACPTEDKLYNSDITYEKYQDKIGECYFGYSLDKEHRYEAATAGIVTEIASTLLEMGHIDGVVSSYQDSNNNIITKIFTDSIEVKKTRGSIYRQVPLLNGLAEKIIEGKHKKVLVIGLSCHIEGLKTLHKTNRYLKKNVEFITIALFCKQTKTEGFSDTIRKLLKVKNNDTITYRGKGWPGWARTSEKNKIKYAIRGISRLWASYAFAPDYCMTCTDPLGVIADISVGDAWVDKYANDSIGSSLFVANSAAGLEVIKLLKKSDKIHIEKEDKTLIIESQNPYYVKFKTSNLKERIAFYNNEGTNTIPKPYLRLLKLIKLNKKLHESKIMFYCPTLILRIYNKIYRTVLKKMETK